VIEDRSGLASILCHGCGLRWAVTAAEAAVL
jgi:hypothetical protein